MIISKTVQGETNKRKKKTSEDAMRQCQIITCPMTYSKNNKGVLHSLREKTKTASSGINLCNY